MRKFFGRDVIASSKAEVIENLRLGIEVLTGKRARLKHIDYDKGNATFFVGFDETEVGFLHKGCTFRLGPKDSLFHQARIEGDVAQVEDPATRWLPEMGLRDMRGVAPMVFVGRSYAERTRVPLFPKGSRIEEYKASHSDYLPV